MTSQLRDAYVCVWRANESRFAPCALYDYRHEICRSLCSGNGSSDQLTLCWQETGPWIAPHWRKAKSDFSPRLLASPDVVNFNRRSLVCSYFLHSSYEKGMKRLDCEIVNQACFHLLDRLCFIFIAPTPIGDQSDTHLWCFIQP